MPSTLKPKHPHECNDCTFLGAHIQDGVWHDLYFCPQNTRPTLIARYGEGGRYMSGLCFAGELEPLAVAKRMAQQRGLLHAPDRSRTAAT